MASGLRRSIAAFVSVALVLAIAPGASGKAYPSSRAFAAAGYLKSQQAEDGSICAFSCLGSTADAVVSAVAAGRRGRWMGRALRYLRDHIEEANTVGLKSKVAMAAVAIGKDPRDFGGHDLISEIIASQQPDGNYGGESPAEVFDHALAMLALSAVVDSQLDPANNWAAAIQWLIDAQCGDGGWQFDEPASPSEDEQCLSGDPNDFDRSNVDTTSLAVQALAGTGSAPAHDPIAFLDAARDPQKHGWGYDPSFPLTNANSTALAIQAYAAQNVALPDGAMRALKALQYRICGEKKGAFAFTWEDPDGDGTFTKTAPDVGATIGGILGHLREPLPITHPIVGVVNPCA